MSTELEQVTMAVAAINKVEAGLAVLRETYAGIVYPVTTTQGMDDAKVARAAIREPRYEVERIRKAAKAPILALGKKLDSEAARITAELEKIEGPIDDQIQAEEARKKAEKEAKIQAEMARVAQIQRFMDGMRGWPVAAAGKSSSLVNQMLQTAADYVISEDVFQERTEEAKTVLIASVAALQGIFQERLTHEAQLLQLEADRKELARLKAEDAERQRVAREAQAKADAETKAERDAEIAKQAAIDKTNRERNEAAFQEIQAIHHQLIIADTGRRPYCNGGDLASIDFAIDGTEKWNLTEDRFGALHAAAIKAKETTLAALRAKRMNFLAQEANEVERLCQAEAAAKIIADREQLEREQAALAEAMKPKPEVAKPRVKISDVPDREDILNLVMAHYKVQRAVAIYYLSFHRWQELAA